MLRKIISGAQTGADRAGLDAAILSGIPHGGWVPKGRKAEDGPVPLTYAVSEMATGSYTKRTERNVVDSDGTVIFFHGTLTGGSLKTSLFAQSHSKPCLLLDMGRLTVDEASQSLLAWIAEHTIEVLNVAGPRASKDERIYAVTKAVLLCSVALVRGGGA